MRNYIIAGAERQRELDASTAEFLASGRKITELPSHQVKHPVRKTWVDPETVLARKRNVKRSETVREFDRQMAEREQLRRMARSL